MKAIALILALLASVNINTSAAKVTTIPPDISGLLARTTVVIKTDYDADVVTVEDASGFIWQFYGCEDWIVGDVASLILWDRNNTTDTILDDEIISAKYAGYTAADFT